MNEGVNMTYEFDCSNGTSALYVYVGAFPSPSVLLFDSHPSHISSDKNLQALKKFVLTLKTPQDLAI